MTAHVHKLLRLIHHVCPVLCVPPARGSPSGAWAPAALFASPWPPCPPKWEVDSWCFTGIVHATISIHVSIRLETSEHRCPGSVDTDAAGSHYLNTRAMQTVNQFAQYLLCVIVWESCQASGTDHANSAPSGMALRLMSSSTCISPWAVHACSLSPLVTQGVKGGGGGGGKILNGKGGGAGGGRGDMLTLWGVGWGG